MKVHAANVQDRVGAKLLLEPLQEQAQSPEGTSFPRLRLIWADKGYTGALDDWMEENLGCRLEVVSYPTRPSIEEEFWQTVKQRSQAGVTGPELYVGLSLRRSTTGSMPVVPRRWVVERSFAWLGRNRRLSKDYEMLPCSSEAFVYLAMIRLMLKRLGQQHPLST